MTIFPNDEQRVAIRWGFEKMVKPIFPAIFLGAPSNTTCIHYTVSAFFLGGWPTFCSKLETPMSSPLKRLSAAGNAVSSMWQGRSFFFSLHSPEAAPAIEVGAAAAMG